MNAYCVRYLAWNSKARKSVHIFYFKYLLLQYVSTTARTVYTNSNKDNDHFMSDVSWIYCTTVYENFVTASSKYHVPYNCTPDNTGYRIQSVSAVTFLKYSVGTTILLYTTTAEEEHPVRTMCCCKQMQCWSYRNIWRDLVFSDWYYLQSWYSFILIVIVIYHIGLVYEYGFCYVICFVCAAVSVFVYAAV